MGRVILWRPTNSKQYNVALYTPFANVGEEMAAVVLLLFVVVVVVFGDNGMFTS